MAGAVCTLALLLVGSLYSKQLPVADYLLLQLQIASFLGIIATGAMLVILLGGIDLSVPWVVTVGGMMSAAAAGWWGGAARPSPFPSASCAARRWAWSTASAWPTCACPR
jgi:ribose transport system permease protein